MKQASECILLYQAFGNRNVFNQVLFSLLTLHFHVKEKTKDLPIVIYTDNPNFFSKYKSEFNLKIEILNAQKLEAFKGKQRFIHRVKVCVIKDCFEKYKSNILYLDSDTYFTESLIPLFDKISKTTSIMNSNDYNLIEADDLYENDDWLLIRKAIRNFDYNIENENVRIPLSTRMWNAGVIGISYDNRHLLDGILCLTDQIFQNKPVFTAEQFAFSYYLQNNTDLISSGNIIFHYWRNFYGSYWKNNYDYYFNEFFNNNLNNPIELQAANAYKLTLKHNNIVQKETSTKIDKIIKRLQKIKKVILTGKCK